MPRPIFNSETGKTIVRYTAHIVEDGDFGRSLAIQDNDHGENWTEPLDGWEYVMDTVRGVSPYFRKKGIRYYETPQALR